MIESTVEDTKIGINYSINHCSSINFIKMLEKSPTILHFIGHGVIID